jgi:hypothetical protein
MQDSSIARILRAMKQVSRRAQRALALAALATVAAASTGCATVAPYERAKLAHPTMTASDLATMGAQHLRAISEGATGGSAGAGSGCGCN